MRSPDGCMEITGPGAGARTRDVIVCGHCQQVIPVNPSAIGTVVAEKAERDVAWCGACGRFVCGPCKGLAVKQGRCLNFEAQVDRQLQVLARRQQTARALGLEA